MDVVKKKAPQSSQTTLVLRPQQGFVLNRTKPNTVTMALRVAAQLTDAESNATSVELQAQNNIAVIKTSKSSAAAKLEKIRSVKMQGEDCAVVVYTLPPEDSCKGVIHNVTAGTPPGELLANLKAEVTNIIRARMMGKS